LKMTTTEGFEML